MGKKLTQQEFLERICKKYPALDFSNVNYINSQTKIHIICPKHGDIYVTPNQILMSKSKWFCQKCSVENGQLYSLRYNSTAEFLNRFAELYPEQYNYFDFSKTVYTGIRAPIIITCPIHGDIITTPFSMLLPVSQRGANGKMCITCNRQQELNICFNSITKQLLLQFPNILVQTNSLQYSQSIPNNSLNVELFCKKHNRTFAVKFSTLKKCIHDNRNPCCNCHGKFLSRQYTNNEFIDLLKNIYPDKGYDYAETVYTDWYTKVKIKCPAHGFFYRKPQRLSEGRGCPMCKESLLEREMRLFLIEQKIDFIYQYRNPDILGLRSLDFYLPSFNAGIECQGKQHLNTNSIFNKENLNIQDIYANDQRKQKQCQDAGIKLYYFTNIIPDIPYFDKLWYNKKDLLETIING